MSVAETTGEGGAKPVGHAYQLGGSAAWYGLALVSFIQAMSLLDRQILAILLPDIKADLGISDADAGLLYGTVFALFYAVFSLPLGRLADGWIRTRLLAMCTAGWSVMTALAGFANGFGLLMTSRLGVGIGEAAAQPAGMSIIIDLFPKKLRGTVTAILAAAISLGIGGAMFFGGWMAEAWNTRFADGGAPLGLRGWQAAFIVASLPGFVLAFLLALFKEPVRGLSDGRPSPVDPAPFSASAATLAAVLPGSNWLGFVRNKATASVWRVNLIALAGIIAFAWALIAATNAIAPDQPILLSLGGLQLNGNELQWCVFAFGAYVIVNWMQSLQLTDRPTFALFTGTPTLVLLLTLAALQSVINYGAMAFTPTFLIREYGLSPKEVGIAFGGVAGAVGIIAPLIGGPISDWLNTKFEGGRNYLTLFALTVGPLLGLWAYTADSATQFYIRFACYGMVLTMWISPIYAAFMDLVLPRMRGMIMSLYILSMTILGLGVGPYAVGLISDLNGGNIRHAILSTFWLCPLVALLTIIAVRLMPKDAESVLARAQAAGEPA